MSVNVDDHGAHPHPTGRLTRFGDAAASAGVHSAYLVALRDGTPGHPYRVPIACGLTVTLTITAPGPRRPPYDTTRETESWRELRAVITDIHASGVTCVLHPGLPREIATATWTRDGHRVRVTRPGAPRPAVRAARSRWHALTATPLIAALTEKAGQLTIGSVTAAALLVPVPPIPPPPVVDAPIHAGDLGADRDRYNPGLPVLPAASAPPKASPMPLLPEPRHDAAKDQTPDPSPAPAVTLPASGPLPVPSPRTSPTLTWSPTPAEPPDTTPLDDASPDPSPTATEEPALAPSRRVGPPPDRRHRPGRRHGHHRKHGHHRHHRGR